MIRLEETIQHVINRLRKLPPLFEEAARQAMKETGDEIVRTLRSSARPRGGAKVNWDTERQRRAYFATGGFGAGIPYRRTGATQAAWSNDAISNGYLVSNVGHKAAFLYGTASGVGTGGHVTPSGQSHIHVGFWPRFRPLVDSILVRLPQRVYAALKVRTGRDG